MKRPLDPFVALSISLKYDSNRCVGDALTGHGVEERNDKVVFMSSGRRATMHCGLGMSGGWPLTIAAGTKPIYTAIPPEVLYKGSLAALADSGPPKPRQVR